MKTTKFMNRILSLVLAVVMVIGLLPMTSFTTSAVNISTSSSTIQKGHYIYFGSSGQKWRVLDASKTSMGTDGMFLLSENSLGLASSGPTAQNYTTNGLKAWCTQYYNGTNFTTAEKSVMLATTVAKSTGTYDGKTSTNYALNGDYLFLLSAAEAANSAYFADDEARVLDHSKYQSKVWFLRTDNNLGTKGQLLYVSGLGKICLAPIKSDGGNGKNWSYRPGFNLDTSKLLFVTAATNGKSNGLSAVSTSGSEWKLTLKDSNSFKNGASISKTTLCAGQSVTVKHTALSAISTDYTDVTAAIFSGDTMLYYGSVNTNTSATSSTVTLPADLATGSYTLKLYGEDWNGDKRTDIATGTPYSVDITVQKHTGGMATCTTQAVCDICGESYGEVRGHTPVYSAIGSNINVSCSANCGYTGTATISATGKTYDGNAVEVVVSKTGALENTDIPVTLTKDGEAFTGEPVNIGTYTASITLGDKTVSVEFTIKKSDVLITAPTPNTLTYTGEALNLITAGEANGGTMVYSLTENGEYTTTIPQGTNAGDYTVWYYVQGDENHNDSEKVSVSVNIKKATPTAENFVFAAPSDLIYDGSAKPATITVKDGIVGMGEINVIYFRDAGMWIDNEREPIYPGTYKVGIWLSEGDNYTAVYSGERIWLGNEFNIVYLKTNAEAIISGTMGSNGWYTSDVTLTAPEGYQISKTKYTDGFSNAFTVSSEQSETITYYLRDVNGDIAEKTATLKIDKTAPFAKYQIGTNGWKQFINTITFGLFCKDYKTVDIEYTDELSGIAEKQYYIANAELSEDELKNIQWNNYIETLNLNATGKYFIYMRVVDNAGHEVILNTEGIVIYEDSIQVTESVFTTYKAGIDKSVTVELKGNTINKIVNGSTTLTADADYIVSKDGIIELKASYLDALNAGEYTFTVSYNPQGVETDKVNMTTTFTVKVEKAEGNVINLNTSGKTYDGNAVTAPTFDKLGDGDVTIEYKLKGADDSTYTTEAPKNAGDYIVRVSVAEGTNYKATSATAEFTIDKVAITITADEKSKTYGEDDPTLTWNITSGALVDGEQLMDITAVRTSGENAGTYDIALSQAEGANKNYAITFVGGILTINAKAVAATVVVNDAQFIYNGSKHEPEIVVKDGDTVISASEYEVIYSNNINAGTATVTVTDKDGGNYVVNGTTTFIINKADPVIGTVGVDGIVKDITKPSEVVLTRTETTVDGVLKLEDEAMLANKLTYIWVFTPTDTDNYNVIKGDIQIDVLDTVLPTIAIKVDTNDWNQFNNNITFELFFKEMQKVTIIAADNENGSGIKEILYFVSDKNLDENDLATVEWKPYTEAFDIEPDGKYVIYAKITDNDGNTVVINSDGVVVDETAAVVSGITDGETYYGQLMFTVTDELAGVKSVVIDGVDKTHFEGQYVINGDNAQHTVVVTDNAGNMTEYKVTVYKNYTVIYKIDGETISTETVGHGKDATLPAVPAKDGYVDKWDSDGKNITGDTTITAIYTAILVVKPDEVKPEDKTELEDTKTKLEEELKDDSYTEEEKKEIQDAIDNIDDVLEVIENVDAVEELIDKLPDTIKKDDEAAIKTAEDAYNALNDYEKSLVDEDAKKALDDAKAALAELNKPADTDNPQTGYNSDMLLLSVLLFIIGAAVITLTVVDRKRRMTSEKK